MHSLALDLSTPGARQISVQWKDGCIWSRTTVILAELRIRRTWLSHLLSTHTTLCTDGELSCD